MSPKELLKKIVGIPSISKNEDDVSNFICDYLNDNGVSAKVYKKNVYCSVGKGKPSILLNSHLDTVPVCPGWIDDPFKAVEKNGYIYGLGANDAKGSLSAMITALLELSEIDLDGKVYFGASVEEETGNKGIKELVHKIPSIDAAIVGEPTNLNIATAMRGLAILKCKAVGKSAHASRPGEGKNAIYEAASDILGLKSMSFGGEHPLLGHPTASVTLIQGGTKNNVIPGECEFTMDVRSTPGCDNYEMIDILSNELKVKAEIVSNRLHPKETKGEEYIVKAAKKVIPDNRIIGFKGMCDYVFIDAPGIILGPGTSDQSHAPNEHIQISQVERASSIYRDIVKEYIGWSG